MTAFRLTSYQQSYVDNRLEGMNQTEALRQSLYKTDSYSGSALRVQATKLERHPNIRLAIDRGRTKVAQKAQYTLERAVEMALEDWEQAKELGQMGAANAANRLASDLMGYLIDRRREVEKDEDPIARMMSDIQGRSRITPNHDGSERRDH